MSSLRPKEVIRWLRWGAIAVLVIALFMILHRDLPGSVQEACSCLYVSENPELLCRKNAGSQTLTIDTTKKQVSGGANVSHFISASRGCSVETDR